MAESGQKVLSKMLERLYAALSAGPALNCRPQNSRQRIDLRQMTKIAGVSAEGVLTALLGSDAATKVVSSRRQAATPAPESELSDEERAVRKTWEEEQAVFQKLRLVAEDAKSYEQEFGHHVLYVGFPLLHLPPGQMKSGRQSASKRILAPIAFIPVKLIVKTGRMQSVELACAAEGADRVIPNTALLAWIEQQTGTRFDELFADEEGTQPWREIDELVSTVCKALTLERGDPIVPDAPLESTPRSDAEEAKQPGVVRAAVLGLYPLSNQSLIRDTEAMLAGESLEGPVESFLRADAGLGGPSKAPHGLTDKRHFQEDRLVSFADPCQARAVRLARDSRGLVIHGPPGTGKSQTIANVIGDHLARGERVLFVCDKRTALDVVLHRLTHLGLGQLCAIVHDAHRDQRDLYMGVREQLDGLAERKPNDASQTELAAVDGELTQIHEELTQYERALAESSGAAEPSFHSLVGEWLAIEVSERAGVARQIGEPRLRDLPPQEKHVREVLDRAAKEEYAANPWRGGLAISLSDLLARPHSQWERDLQAIVDAAKEADATGTSGVMPFSPDGDPEKEGQARQALADAIGAIVAAPEGTAALVRASTRDATALMLGQRELEALSPQRKVIEETPLDPELAATERAEPIAPSQAGLWLGKLSSYFEIAQKWYRFLFFGRRRRALEVLQRFGLGLSISALERATAFLERVRAQRVLQAWHTNQLGPGSSAGDDGQLLRSMSTHAAIYDLFKRLEGDPALASCAGAVRAALAAPERHAELVAGLRLSGRRGQVVARLERLLDACPLFTSASRGRVEADLRQGGNVHLYLSALAARGSSLEGMVRIRDGIASFPSALADFVEKLGQRTIEADEGWSAIRKAVLAGEVERRLRESPMLQAVDGGKLHAYHERFRALDARKRELVRDTIVHRWVSSQRERLLASTGTRLNATGTELRRRLTLRGERAMRVRQVVAAGSEIEGGDPLFDMRPVWMASPDTVAQIFPRAPIFDVVIFDEASQCRLEEALPVLTRAKRVVIAGDPKQLPPTRFFESAVAQSQESEAESDQELFEEQQADVEDLLAAALNLEIEQCYLDVHYRSRNADLIGFSNQSFYDSRLQAIPGHPSNRAVRAPLRLIPVGGIYDQRVNLKEAEAVVGIVRELLARPEPPSIGVACFNLAQREAILNALEDAAASDSSFAQKLATARTRRGAGSFEGLFVKNLENVQGDERDHMIISTTYGPDPKGRFYRRFGPLGRAGGGRRLNVLVTRARDEVHLLTSIPREIYNNLPVLAPGQTPNGAWLLYSYLNFAELLARAYDAEAQRLAVASASKEVSVNARATESGSRFAQAFAERLANQHGTSSDVHWGNDGFCVDIALHHPTRAEDVTIGVLCDGARFAKAADRVEWDLFRTEVLRQLGWALVRVWTPHVYRDPEGALRSISAQAEAFVSKEPPRPVPGLSRPEPSAPN